MSDCDHLVDVDGGRDVLDPREEPRTKGKVDPESAVDAPAAMREVLAVLARIRPPDQGAVVVRVDQQLDARVYVRAYPASIVEVEDGPTRPPPERPYFLAQVEDAETLAILHDVSLHPDPIAHPPPDVQPERYPVRFVAADDRQLVQGGTPTVKRGRSSSWASWAPTGTPNSRIATTAVWVRMRTSSHSRNATTGRPRARRLSRPYGCHDTLLRYAAKVAGSFDRLALLVDAGNRATATEDTECERTGRLIGLSPAALALLTDGARHDLRETQVETIVAGTAHAQEESSLDVLVGGEMFLMDDGAARTGEVGVNKC